MKKCHDVKKAQELEFVRGKFALFTCDDIRREPWLSPVDHLFSTIETKFDRIRDHLKRNRKLGDEKPVKCLEQVC